MLEMCILVGMLIRLAERGVEGRQPDLIRQVHQSSQRQVKLEMQASVVL